MVASSVFGGKNSKEKTGRVAFSISVIFVGDAPPLVAALRFQCWVGELNLGGCLPRQFGALRNIAQFGVGDFPGAGA